MASPSTRAFRNAAIAATILAGPFIAGAISSNSSGQFWFSIILWLAFAVAFFRGFAKLEILWHLDREAAKDEAAKDEAAKKAARLRPPPLPGAAYRRT
jgi:hypothetical protein